MHYNYHPEKPIEKLYIPPESDLDWLKINEGKAEIHMMALAEAMYDAYNESEPKLLKAGEWHIPFGDNIELPPTIPIDEGYTLEEGVNLRKVQIAVARCARVSYTVVGEEKQFDYEKDIKLHDDLSKSGHWSAFEHCAKAMNENEHRWYHNCEGGSTNEDGSGSALKTVHGVSGNFKGFIQYRKMFKGEDING